MRLEDVIEITSMMTKISIVGYGNVKCDKYGKVSGCKKYDDISEVEDSPDYDNIKNKKVVWLSAIGSELAITIE